MGARGIACMALLVGACGRIGFDAPGGTTPGDDTPGSDGGPGDGGGPDAALRTPTARPVVSGANVSSGALAVTLNLQIQNDLMVVVINVNSATDHVTSVTDTSGHTFVSANVVSTSATNPGGNVVTEIWYSPVEIATVPNRITVNTQNSASMWDVTVLMLTQIDLSNPIEMISTEDNVPGTATIALTDPMTVGGNTAIVVANSCSNLAGLGAGSPFQVFSTMRNDDIAYLVGAHDGGSFQANWMCSGTCGQYNVSAVAFRARPL